MLRMLYRSVNLWLNVDNNPETNGEYWLVDRFANERVFLDVGYNCGDWSNRVLQVAPQAKIHAFDPDRGVAQQVRVGPDSAITFHNVAVAAEAGRASFRSFGPCNPSNLLKPLRESMRSEPERDAYEVDVITLDDWAQACGIDEIGLLKIDAEGHDYAVLEGARGLFADQKISACVFEYGYPWLEAQHLLADAARFFEAVEYSLFRLFPSFLAPYRWQSAHENVLSGMFVAVSTTKLVDLRLPQRALATWGPQTTGR